MDDNDDDENYLVTNDDLHIITQWACRLHDNHMLKLYDGLWGLSVCVNLTSWHQSEEHVGDDIITVNIMTETRRKKKSWRQQNLIKFWWIRRVDRRLYLCIICFVYDMNRFLG